MGLEAATIAAIGLGVSAAGTAASIIQQGKASDAAEKARKRQNALSELQNRRARIQSIREARVKRAAILARGEAAGASDSTGVQGGVASLQGSLGSSIGFQGQVASAQRGVASAQGQAVSAANRANTYSAIAELGGTIFSGAGGFETLFSPKKTP